MKLATSVTRPKVGYVLLALAMHASVSAQGQKQTGSMNRYGSSGLVTIPTADIAPEGSFDWSISRAFDPLFTVPRGTNYLFVTSPYHNVELGARLSEYAIKAPGSNLIVGGARDLSANVKLQLVRSASGTRAAVGLNDVAGGAVNLRSAYGVVTQDIGPVSASAGYVMRGANGRKGVFGGVRLALYDPIYVLADMDPYQASLAARAQVQVPFLPTSPRLDVTLARVFPRNLPLQSSQTDVQVALRFALDHAASERETMFTSPPVAPSAFPVWPVGLASAPADASVTGTQKRLVTLGFGNVMVRHDGKQAWVRVQNVAFAHSHFDAVAVVLSALARELPESVDDLFVQLQVNKVDVAQVYAKRSSWQRFLGGGVRPVVGSELRVNKQMSALPAVSEARDSAPVTVRIEPALKTYFGTEVGVIDYALAARATALWEGLPVLGGRLLASASVLSSAVASESFKPGGVDEKGAPKSGLEAAMVHWAGWATPSLLSVASIGKHDTDYAGVSYEGQWLDRRLPFDQSGIAIFRGGHFKNTANRALPDRTYARASVRTYIAQADLTAEVGIGQFQAKDRGPSLDVSRNFGDLNFGATWRYTDRHFFGIQMGIPLTPRVNRSQIGAFHFTGTNSFSHSARTSYLGKGQVNAVIPSAAQMPLLPLDISTHLMDRNRLTDAQLYSYLLPMRDFARRVLADEVLR